MYKIFITSKAKKQLVRLAKKDAKKTVQIILKITYPFSRNLDIKKIVGQNKFYRLRFGRVRVIFEIDKKKKEIWIRKIDYRSGAYRLF